jgi:PhoPQ-activated pathogenicity-related protein
MGKKLIQIVDPINYKKILKMPKYIVSSTGDEFFVPDSSELFYKYLEGEKLLRYVPNVNQIFSFNFCRHLTVSQTQMQF